MFSIATSDNCNNITRNGFCLVDRGCQEATAAGRRAGLRPANRMTDVPEWGSGYICEQQTLVYSSNLIPPIARISKHSFYLFCWRLTLSCFSKLPLIEVEFFHYAFPSRFAGFPSSRAAKRMTSPKTPPLCFRPTSGPTKPPCLSRGGPGFSPFSIRQSLLKPPKPCPK
jgi:hypothetical protein